MGSNLTIREGVSFFARVTLRRPLNNDLVATCIDRAYSTLSRNLNGMGPLEKNLKQRIKDNVRELISNFVTILITEELTDHEFNLRHRDLCSSLISEFRETGVVFTIGHAQKWINMTIKYLTMLRLCDLSNWTQNEINIFDKNFEHYHFPVDDVVLKHADVRHFARQRYISLWTLINDYENYLGLQHDIKTDHQNLLDFEFEVWINNAP